MSPYLAWSKIRISIWGDHLGLPSQALNPVISVGIRVRWGKSWWREDSRQCGWLQRQTDGCCQHKGCQVDSGRWKSQRKDSPLEHLEGRASLLTAWFQTSSFQNGERIIFLSHQFYGNLLWKSQETRPEMALGPSLGSSLPQPYQHHLLRAMRTLHPVWSTVGSACYVSSFLSHQDPLRRCWGRQSTDCLLNLPDSPSC